MGRSNGEGVRVRKASEVGANSGAPGREPKVQFLLSFSLPCLCWDWRGIGYMSFVAGRGERGGNGIVGL